MVGGRRVAQRIGSLDRRAEASLTHPPREDVEVVAVGPHHDRMQPAAAAGPGEPVRDEPARDGMDGHGGATRGEQPSGAAEGRKASTLAYGLTDSPAGLAAWIIEKFRRWSDCGGDLDTVYDRDDLLTNLTIYWVTQTIGSSMRLYYETAHSSTAGWGRVTVPTGMAMSGNDMFPTPREWAERSYEIVHWTELPRGGHFLEWEVPDLVAEDVKAFFADYR